MFASTLVLAVVATAPTTGPKLSVMPCPSLIDQPLAIQVSGLAPGQRVSIVARAIDADQRVWRSHAVFTADARGRTDLTRQKPDSGSYELADGSGLLWSMRPDSGGGLFARGALKQYTTEFAVIASGDTVARARCVRKLLADDVRIRDVRTGGMFGRMWHPDRPGRHPTILLLTGGSGGIQNRFAPLLASHGYTVFSLAYFNYESLPSEQVEIPIEYFDRAVAWLTTQPEVDSARIAVMGHSKGGELALLLGTMMPQLKAVVSYVGSPIIWEGAMQRRGGVVVDPRAYKSGWTYRGRPLPYLEKTATPEATAKVAASAAHSRDLFEMSLHDTVAVTRAMMPLERIRGPVLLFSGKRDVAWPSSPMGELAVRRMKERGHPYSHEHVAYENAGHVWEDGYLPVMGFAPIQGGTPYGNAEAQADSWRRVLQFFERHLLAASPPGAPAKRPDSVRSFKSAAAGRLRR